MKIAIICWLVTLGATLLISFVGIPILKKINFGQPILKYLPEHKGKSGTPTLGGLFFLLPSAIVFFAFGGYEGRIGVVIICIMLAFATVGLLDDLIKIKTKNNEGLKPYQKIIFQVAISILAGVFAYKNGLTVCFLPFTKITFDVGWGVIPITFFVFIAITNSVNLTDGLDGLASGTSFAYLLSLSLIISAQTVWADYLYLVANEYQNIIKLSSCFCGGLLGFLFFNVNKAKVFMGDTGSLALGGLIGGVSVFSGNTLFIAVVGIMFVFSSISVIIQVIHYKRTRRRIFTMAPFHHHLQHKGFSEAKISYFYFIITLALGAICLLFYL